jgi:hypothetical protein
MKQTKFHILLINILTFGSLITTQLLVAKTEVSQHNIQLQLSDSNGFPVAGTEFWVTIDVVKDESLVTLNLPLINFQTGQVSTDDPYFPSGQVIPGFPPLGGYLYTADGFLPKDLRPIDLVPRAIVAASNNGMSPVFSFTQDPDTLPQPPAGYIVQVTNAGAIVVQQAGTFGNIIAPGPQVLMPCSITYSVQSIKKSINSFEKLDDNVKISKGASNVTQFIGGALSDGYRDSHVNDAFDGVVGFAWTDNAGFVNLNNGTMDTMVAIGKVKDGELKIKKITNLTNFPDLPRTPTNHGIQSWDTAVAINRTNSDNIVVSYGVIDRTNSPAVISLPHRAVSFDGGKTWPINGLMNVLPTGTPATFGDNLGVASDKFGNIWYSSSNRFDGSGNFINQAYFAASTDGGITFELVFTVPIATPELTDYPQYCFGTDSTGQYGLYFQTTFAPNIVSGLDAFPSVGFIPINGLGLFGATQYTTLPGLAPALVTADITASNDGKVWIQGNDSGDVAPPYSFIQPLLIAFKSPSGAALDLNWAGAWDTAVVNNIASTFGDNGEVPAGFPQPISFQHYILASTRSILYDESRQALYALTNGQYPDFGQNMEIYFIISRDNGMTWSDPVRVNSSHFANRGFQSMALDSTNGNLIFGWYDGRNDKTYQTVEYFGTVLTAHELDKMVNAIPLSNPNFIVPSVAPVGP